MGSGRVGVSTDMQRRDSHRKPALRLGFKRYHCCPARHLAGRDQSLETVMERTGIEPVTSGLQRRRDTSLGVTGSHRQALPRDTERPDATGLVDQLVDQFVARAGDALAADLRQAFFVEPLPVLLVPLRLEGLGLSELLLHSRCCVLVVTPGKLTRGRVAAHRHIADHDKRNRDQSDNDPRDHAGQRTALLASGPRQPNTSRGEGGPLS